MNPVTASDVASALSAARFTANTESALQIGVRDLLNLNFPGAFIREYQGFGRRDRPDFYCEPAGIVLEVKISTSGGTAPKVFAQLGRYAEHARVRELIFATPSRRIASLIGDTVGGKPITRVVLHTGF